MALSQRSHNDEVEDNVVEQLNDVKSNSASIDSTVCGYEAIKSWSNKQEDSQYIVCVRVASQNKEFASSSRTCQPFNLIIG